MIVTRLAAEKVHSYLPIEIEFLPDLTFLTGLNGSGKTTALRLLIGLLTPNLEELTSISFHKATVTVSDQGTEIVVAAQRTPEGLTLSTTEVDEVLSLTSADIQLLTEVRHRDEPRHPVYDQASAHPVFKAIAGRATPMFLGLDRRFSLGSPAGDDAMRLRRRDIEYRRGWLSDSSIRTGTAASLTDVSDLVSSSIHEIRARQERLDEQLRGQILLDAFRYSPTEKIGAAKLPTRGALEEYRTRLAAVERAAGGLKVPVGEVQLALDSFLERMNQVVDSLERATEEQSKRKKKDPQAVSPEIFEWLMNKPQADRIFSYINLLVQYGVDRSKLHEPIDRFLALTNSFLNQTSVNTSKAAIRDHFKTGQRSHTQDTRLFYRAIGTRGKVILGSSGIYDLPFPTNGREHGAWVLPSTERF